MSNRRFEMHQYRHIIHRMRMGESDRIIAKTGLIGCRKAGELRQIAWEQGWLDPGISIPCGIRDVLENVDKLYQRFVLESK